jgi:hypothetical protein
MSSGVIEEKINTVSCVNIKVDLGFNVILTLYLNFLHVTGHQLILVLL